MALDNPALTFALAMAAGIVGQTLAWHLRIPGIVLLLALGVVLGPDVANLVRPESLGHGLDEIVGLAVAVVLFEGGLNLQWQRLRSEAKTIRRLITIGGAVTAAGGTLAAMAFMGWDWRAALLLGSIVVVTGPTVITPILRRIRIKRNLHTILEAEAVLIDPIGAVLAVVLLEFVLASTASSAAASLLGLPVRLAAGAVMGLAGGLLLALALRRERTVPEGQESIFTLAWVLALFEISNAVFPESGIMTAAVAGLVVGNMRTRVASELREFKEQLTVLLIGLLFVLLAADVRVADVVALGWPAVLTVAVLMLFVRPADVAVSTIGAGLTLHDKAFLSWLAPRGIVAAAIASVFGRRLADSGIPGGDELLPLVFLVIAATVVFQGGTAGLVATALGVRRPRTGWAILGANPLGRALAWSLQRSGEPVVLIDRNAAEVSAAEEAGFRAVYGDISEERTMLQADIEARRGIITLTPNDGLNLILAERVVEATRTPGSWVAVDSRTRTITGQQVESAGSRVLFGDQIDVEDWIHRFHHGTVCLERWQLGEGGKAEAFSGLECPLTVERGGTIAPVDERVSVRPGDIVCVALPIGDESTRARLLEAGWVSIESTVTETAES